MIILYNHAPESIEKRTKRMKKIISIAKQIRKEHPNKEWKTCISEASKEYVASKK